MFSFIIIELNIFKKSFKKTFSVLVFFQVNMLIFNRPPKPFDRTGGPEKYYLKPVLSRP